MCRIKDTELRVENCCTSHTYIDGELKDNSHIETDDNNDLARKPFIETRDRIKPPDGGWGYVVIIGSFITYFISDGWAYSFGIIFKELLDHFQESHAKTSIIGALIYAVPLTISPLICGLCNVFGCRIIGIIGGIICFCSFICSAFANSIEVLILTLGVMTSIGLSMAYLSAYLSVTFYFEQKRGLAIGLAVTGSGLGAFAFPPLIKFLLEYYAWRGTLMLIGAIFLHITVAGALFRPLEKTEKIPAATKELVSDVENSKSDRMEESGNNLKRYLNTGCRSLIHRIFAELKAVCQSMLDKEIYKNLCYLTFCASTFVTYLWIGTLYIYLIDKVMLLGINYTKAAFLMSLIGIGRTVGQIIMGYLGDIETINTVLLYSVSIAFCGLSTLLVPVCEDYISLTIITLTFGFFVSSTYTLQILCLVKMFGLEKATCAFGFLQLTQGLATFLGTPLTGWMFDELADYNPPFYVAGGMLIFSAILLLPVFISLRKVRSEEINKD